MQINKKEKVKSSHKRIGKRGVYLLKGAIFGLVVFAILLSVAAIIVTNSDIESNKYTLIIHIIVPVSAFIASFYAGLKSKLKGIAAGLLQTTVFIIPLSLIILSVNKFSVTLMDLLFIPVSFIAGAVAGIISVNIKR